MTDWLIFGLSATMAAMGDHAGHERRGSGTWPGRSAIVGLMGAALGIERTGDFSTLEALDISVAIFDTGVPLRDFHTIQTVPNAAAKSPNSRPEAMRTAGPLKLNTVLTKRDYRAGVFYGIAISGAPEILDQLGEALRYPRYQLFLGRKSCPLSTPPGPVTRLTATDAEEALQALALPPWRKTGSAYTLVMDARAGDADTETRHDRAVSRAAWHFQPRKITYRPVNIALETAADTKDARE